MDLEVKKLREDAHLPERGSPNSAGLDLFSVETVTIPAKSKAMVATGIAVGLRSFNSHYIRIAPRSGLAYKHGLDVLAGVVDADYRGEVKVILANLGSEPHTVHKNDKIAQAIVESIYMPKVVEVEELAETTRGSGGFGSTGDSKNV